MGAAKTIVLFPEAAFGPALNCVGIAQKLKAAGHNPVFVCDKGFKGVFEKYGFEENLVDMSGGMSDEEIVLTVCTGLAGRPYLSGRADLLDEHQRALVRAGVEVHRQMRADLARSHAVWPLGLPGWDDPWVCVGLTGADVLHLVVWHRAGAPDATRLPLPTLRGRDLDVAVAYPPQSSGWSASWAGAAGELEISSDVDEPSARVFRLTVRH